MIHQPYGGVTGQSADIQIQAQQIIKDKNRQRDLRQAHRPVGRAGQDAERDKYFDSGEAKAYGLVDEVIDLPEESLPKS